MNAEDNNFNSPVAVDDPQEVAKQQFQRYRCAIITGIVISSFSLLFLIIAFGTQDVLYAGQDVVGVRITVSVHYFGAKTCASSSFGKKCISKGKEVVSGLTCGKQSGMEAAAAFQFLGLFATLALIVICCVELCMQKDLVPGCNINLTVSGVAIGCLFITNIALGSVRSHAKWSNCKTVMIGLERYAVGTTWLLVILVQIMLFVHVIVYGFRRWGNCCACCCCPYPDSPWEASQVTSVAVHPLQPPGQVFVAAQPAYGQQPLYVAQPVYAYPAVAYPPPQPGIYPQPAAYDPYGGGYGGQKT